MSTPPPDRGPAFRGALTGLLGIGTYLPSRQITNEAICERIDSSDDWIRSRSGIRVRYWAEPTETVEFMAATAAERALEHAGIAADEVGCVIVSTVSHLHQFPSLAAGVAHRIGAVAPGAFDISAGCAGFCYGLSLASDMVAAGSARYVLVIAVERLSELLDQEDRDTAFLFGDGAGAAVVGPTDRPGVGPVVWGSDGSHKETIRQSHSWAALRDTPAPGWPVITMDGREVFRWAAYQLGPVAEQALERAGVTVGDLDSFVPHQANARITDELVKGLGIPGHVAVARSVEIHGNTSAVSIPLAIQELLASGEARPGGLALLLSFGTGLVWAGQVVRLPPAPAGPPVPASTAPAAPAAPNKENPS
ncbi:beta-ketoacyl-ACP synthase III [Streptomyces sp. 900105755]|uniref:beta-ketoacyl-ACP synthase III n=1 Tax=Streptomyces sp. 900105755 TaxID=3154389 RepID=UPI0033308BB4